MRRNLLLSFAMLTACGKVSGLADAGDGSGTNIDGSVGPDANPRGTVTVTIYDNQNTGAPVAGIPVVFVDPDGKLVGRPTTDADGKASAEVLPGATVTSITPNGTNQYDLKTVLGVKPGDNITLNTPAQGTTAGTFTVNLTARAGAVHYYVYGPCGAQTSADTSLTATLTISNDCKTDQMDLVAIAYDANYAVLGYVNKSGVAYSNNGSTALPTTWSGLSSFTATASNLPAEVTYANINRYWPDSYGYGMGGGGAPTNNAVSVTVSGPSAASALVATNVRDSQGLEQEIRQVNAGNSTSYNLDVSNNLLKWVASPMLDVTTGKVTIAATGTSHGTPDLFATDVIYNRVDAQQVTTYFSWHIYGPDVTDLTLPTLPPEVGDVGPKAGDQAQFYGSTALFDFDNISGYDVARQHPDVTINSYYQRSGATTARMSRSQSRK
jgi:hypothetical protein